MSTAAEVRACLDENQAVIKEISEEIENNMGVALHTMGLLIIIDLFVIPELCGPMGRIIR